MYMYVYIYIYMYMYMTSPEVFIDIEHRTDATAVAVPRDLTGILKAGGPWLAIYSIVLYYQLYHIIVFYIIFFCFLL